jgi:hypothetical protein
MKKMVLCLILSAVLAVPVLAEDPAAPGIDKKVGSAFLDGIAKVFHDMATGQAGSREDSVKRIDDFLVQSMSEATKAKEQNQIDAVFFVRYRRLLGVIKLIMAPDKSGILGPVIDQEIRHFVYEVLGEDFKGTGSGAIGQVANALADEMVNLQLYMDNIETKARLRKAFDEKFSGVTPKKK